MSDRNALHAYLTPESHQTWQLFAEENGVSVTGLLEAFAVQLRAEVEKAEADGGDSTDVRQDWVKTARKVDARRRRRGMGR